MYLDHKQHAKNTHLFFVFYCLLSRTQMVRFTMSKKQFCRKFSKLFEKNIFRDWQAWTLFLKLKKSIFFFQKKSPESGYNLKTVHFIKKTLKYFSIENWILHLKMIFNNYFDGFFGDFQKLTIFQKIITYRKKSVHHAIWRKSWHFMSPKTYKKIKKIKG